ncbi:MAG: methylated-DNA--[protein]-cysteine S-methyltransferase [Actinomycetia bacterium]|nr:methylated-DNA--[protein]-cysteine S-methyltransferase [Actinomycetes bacterium]
MSLFQYKFDTKIGLLYYAWDSNTLLYLGNDKQRFEHFKQKAGLGFKQRRFEHLEQEVDSYLNGHLEQFTINTRLIYGTRFFCKVLNTLKKVGYGQAVSYRRLAEMSGRPKAWRAVGSIMGKNPMMIVIPCHRVIKSDGRPGNYSAGIPIKHFLLKLESKSPA